ncbi:flagellar hook-basal body complex protein FliE [Oceanobacillus piezotolerans]|uniref:Flagellar hook-basal body complex protein FliE n=1 Tax=Oceanobacillus piezotolerans TaxID=2448030 RepID=A0A498DNJ9_9BACI|nr:flagellar hook-basal body complex protein FliE [Oceanobacillus piezotolerans]RLL45312.1 flagellar hook-basal body complex protein FliE [Oceanobacillus piezotolerans]
MITINNLSQIAETGITRVDNQLTPGKAHANFANVLKGALDDLNHIQMESDDKTKKLAAGEIDDLHDVMITAQKASIALETTVQIQKKVIDAYNEIMRMQV